MRTKQPEGLQTGLMWFDADGSNPLEHIRHQAQERDGKAFTPSPLSLYSAKPRAVSKVEYIRHLKVEPPMVLKSIAIEIQNFLIFKQVVHLNT